MCMHNLVRYAANMADQLTPFAEWLRDVAARAGYNPEKRGSTAELARDSGIDVGQISRFLNGKAVPSSANLPALADALGADVDEMARRIAGMEIRESDIAVVDATNLTPEQMIAALGVTNPDDQAAVLHMIERLRNSEVHLSPKRSHTQRGVGGHPRPHTLKEYEQPEE